ncbi:hypothetical protein, partial [Herbaspirillum sp.]|uniref:hypothetical protein n=1 Tax=Herbaspirillum sp. TaxID=1890675 RepID=UPI00258586EF
MGVLQVCTTDQMCKVAAGLVAAAVTNQPRATTGLWLHLAQKPYDPTDSDPPGHWVLWKWNAAGRNIELLDPMGRPPSPQPWLDDIAQVMNVFKRGNRIGVLPHRYMNAQQSEWSCGHTALAVAMYLVDHATSNRTWPPLKDFNHSETFLRDMCRHTAHLRAQALTASKAAPPATGPREKVRVHNPSAGTTLVDNYRVLVHNVQRKGAKMVREFSSMASEGKPEYDLVIATESGVKEARELPPCPP